MPNVTSRSWTDADIARLRKFSEERATVARAAAVLNRKTDAVRKKCRDTASTSWALVRPGPKCAACIPFLRKR